MGNIGNKIRTFELVAPESWSIPAIVSSPHSGRAIPQDLAIATRLTEQQLRRSEDSYVDELFEGCVQLGAPLLRALLSRTYVDLNRDPGEFDQKMFDEPLPDSLRSNSVRAHSGLGVVPRIVSEGEGIYRERLSLADAILRIEKTYNPYHAALSALVDSAQKSMGMSVVLDCHSMPHTAAQGGRKNEYRTIDVVLGDRFGTSCSDEMISIWQQSLQSKGLHVVRNHPYPGGYITHKFGEPHRACHALQIEINRSLYMNETTLEKKRSFAALKATLADCTKAFFNALSGYHSAKTLRAAE